MYAVLGILLIKPFSFQDKFLENIVIACDDAVR